MLKTDMFSGGESLIQIDVTLEHLIYRRSKLDEDFPEVAIHDKHPDILSCMRHAIQNPSCHLALTWELLAKSEIYFGDINAEITNMVKSQGFKRVSREELLEINAAFSKRKAEEKKQERNEKVKRMLVEQIAEPGFVAF